MSLPFDPALAVKTLAEQDRRLARVIERAGPYTLVPLKIASPYQTLLKAIVHQQLSGKAAATIHGRVLALFGGRQGPQPQQVLDAPEVKLRAAGLSRAKVAAVKDLSAKTLEGIVPDLRALKKMDDAEVISRLVSVRGIGQWSVEMLLMFHLGRPDVLPHTDLGVRKGFMLTYKTPELPTKNEIIAHAERRWRPYRSVASWYMWRAVELATKAKPKKC